MDELNDYPARLAALDPQRSFIVQAPAGSGKTGLLVRRYLALLVRVKNPEEVLAITFTRKATAEMKDRILSIVSSVAQDNSLESDLALLAARVLERDRELGWNLVNNPGRMRILTIDALSMHLVRSMPWSSRFASVPRILDDIACQQAYKTAALELLQLAEGRGKDAKHVQTFMELVNADLSRGIRLLVEMLRKRDLWMRGIRTHDHKRIESAWNMVINHHLGEANDLITNDIRPILVRLISYAGNNVDRDHALHRCRDLDSIPDPDHANLDKWKGISELLITKGNSESSAFRKRVDARNGFPAKSKGGNAEIKEQMERLLLQLADESKLLDALYIIRLLPSSGFSDRQWKTLDSVLHVIQLAAGILRLHFSTTSTADFIEINQRAELALVQDDMPTDLALTLDYAISHILMDEIQDTSQAHFELVEILTRGWQPGDGRTLFFVGDPMQSIYRFREAEIGNFLGIQNSGIGNMMPESLVLESNFRSANSMVEWFNQVFQNIFPDQPDIQNGAVPYWPAQPIVDDPEDCGVTLMSRSALDSAQAQLSEAISICQQVEDLTERDPSVSIGILGRTKRHLLEVAAQLHSRNIEFEAVELESLASRPAIQDLAALTRALANPSDNIAWLAILRAPWCGLGLKDLTALCESNSGINVSELVCNEEIKNMSADGRVRLDRFRTNFLPVVQNLGRRSFQRSVMNAWFSLGGPASLGLADCRDCETFFNMLETLEAENISITPSVINARIANLWSNSTNPSKIQLMTIHKSKGLEFDVVFIPSLERRGKNDNADLVQWARLEDQLLVAPLAHSDEDQDEFNQYLKHLEKNRQQHELRRLLYVACTRARYQLFLSASLGIKDSGEIAEPVTGSFLSLMWPGLGESFIGHCEVLPAETDNHEPTYNQFYRFPLDYCPPTPIQNLDIAVSTESAIPDQQVEFSWAGESLRVAGIAIHYMLQNIGPTQWSEWKTRDAEDVVGSLESILVENGLSGEETEQARRNILEAIENIRTDSLADWIFSNNHTQVQCEWALTGLLQNETVNVVMDRSFVDDRGVRWIIDYKSSRHEEDDIDTFLNRELDRYSHQLQRYVEIARLFDLRETRAALYFPLLKGWREWMPA